MDQFEYRLVDGYESHDVGPWRWDDSRQAWSWRDPLNDYDARVPPPLLPWLPALNAAGAEGWRLIERQEVPTPSHPRLRRYLCMRAL